MRGQVQRIDGFQNGIDYRGRTQKTHGVAAPDDKPRRGYVRDALNVVCDENGVLRRRGPWITSDAMESRNYYRIQWLNGVQRLMLSALSAPFHLWAKSATSISAATDISGAIAGNDAVWTEAPAQTGQGPVYGLLRDGTTPNRTVQWTGTGSIATWTATTGVNPNWTFRTAVPEANYILHHQNRVYLANVTGETSSVYFSDIDLNGGGALPRVWPTQNIVRFDPQDGDRITGMSVSGANILVFKQSRLYSIYDPQTGANRVISANIGAEPGSIAVAPNGVVYFYSRSYGVCSTDGRTVTQVGEPIRPALILNFTVSEWAATYHDNFYFLSAATLAPVSPVGGDARMYGLDTRNGSWWSFTPSVSAMAVATQTATRPYIHALRSTSTENGMLAILFVDGFGADGSIGPGGGSATTPSTPYTSEVYLPWQDYGMPHLRKRLRRVRATARGGLDVLVASGYDDTTFASIATDALGTAGASGVVDIPINGMVSNAFSFRLRGDAVADTRWAVEDLTTSVTMRRD